MSFKVRFELIFGQFRRDFAHDGSFSPCSRFAPSWLFCSCLSTLFSHYRLFFYKKFKWVLCKMANRFDGTYS